jgi:hypothetical protein
MLNGRFPINRNILKNLKIGAHGTPIVMHRALRSMAMEPGAILSLIFFPTIFAMIIWSAAPLITAWWGELFEFWIDALKLEGSVSTRVASFFGTQTTFFYPDLPASPPTHSALWWNLIISVCMLLFSGRITRNFLPLAYLLRAVLIIQISSSVFFFVSSDTSTLNASNYAADMTVFSLYFISIIPLLFALIYYVFNFSVWRKFLVTSLAIGYFVIALPMQYMMHSWIISVYSLLFLPVLYLLFGALLDTLILVACYAWAMSWKDKSSH